MPSECLNCPANISRLYDCDQFTDLTINFSGRKVKAHRVVLCIQSEYFSKLCNPDSGFTVNLRKRC